MDHPILTYTKDAKELVIDSKEVLRYLGYGREKITEEDKAMVEKLLPEAVSVMHPRACYGRYELSFDEGNVIQLPYGTITSRDLTRNLMGCQELFLFAATIGPAFDTLIKKKRLTSVAEACVLQSVGAAAVEDFVENLCAFLSQEVQKEGYTTRPRYSPGFGDVPLNNQVGLFKTLQPAKYAGITLMDTLIMAPEKSVTAYVGIMKEK